MNQEKTGFTVSGSLYRAVIYGNGMGFPVFLPDVPQIFKDKAAEMIKGLIAKCDSESIKKPEVDAELCIISDIYMKKCQYELSVYLYSEDKEMETDVYEIYPGTEYYEAFKEYVLQQMEKYLFIK